MRISNIILRVVSAESTESAKSAKSAKSAESGESAKSAKSQKKKEIYALLSVKFSGLKMCQCKKKDKYEVW